MNRRAHNGEISIRTAILAAVVIGLLFAAICGGWFLFRKTEKSSIGRHDPHLEIEYLEALQSALDAGDEFGTRQAIEELGRVGSTQAMAPLDRIRECDSDLRIRRMAANALNRIRARLMPPELRTGEM